jgi:hypothetical protein
MAKVQCLISELFKFQSVVRQPKVDNSVKRIGQFLVLHRVFCLCVRHVAFQSYKSTPIH